MSNNEYMRQYMKQYCRIKKQKAIKLLGGKCIKCNSIKRLEIDHIDPKTKSFEIASLWSRSWTKTLEELKKCQLLCHQCHTKKTILERGQTSAKGTHGTLSSYRYCHCELCKKANRNWTNEYNKKRRNRSLMVKQSALNG